MHATSSRAAHRGPPTIVPPESQPGQLPQPSTFIRQRQSQREPLMCRLTAFTPSSVTQSLPDKAN